MSNVVGGGDQTALGKGAASARDGAAKRAASDASKRKQKAVAAKTKKRKAAALKKKRKPVPPCYFIALGQLRKISTRYNCHTPTMMKA